MMTIEQWAKAIIINTTGRPDDPSPALLELVRDLRAEGAAEALKSKE